MCHDESGRSRWLENFQLFSNSEKCHLPYAWTSLSTFVNFANIMLVRDNLYFEMNFQKMKEFMHVYLLDWI